MPATLDPELRYLLRATLALLSLSCVMGCVEPRRAPIVGELGDRALDAAREETSADQGADFAPPAELELMENGAPTLAHLAHRCVHLSVHAEGDSPMWLSSDDPPQLTGDESSATSVYLQPTALGEVLIYSEGGRYLGAPQGSAGGALSWLEALTQSHDREPQGYSEGEWALQNLDSVTDLPGGGEALRLVHQASATALSVHNGQLTLGRLSEAVARVTLTQAEGCTPHPELSVDAEGEVTRATFEDGDLFGFADIHSHLFANLGFGSGVHGDVFHRLGVTHALSSCEEKHGEEGRLDLWGYFSDRATSSEISGLTQTIVTGVTPEFNHHTDGYPTFTDWPNAPYSSTHQTQYYKWIERAWMGGLRLIVQHAVANQVICELQRAQHPLADQYQCDEMVSVRQSIEATYALERYIDAQYGGEGEGFFRVVTSPAEARRVISEGKLAVVLGIETSKLFNCMHTVIPERPSCTPEQVTAELDAIYELGVRVLFPVHKYDNAFSAGDGARGVLEIANLINSGHYSSFVEDCDLDAPRLFDHGPVTFGGLNQPREVFGGVAPVDISRFEERPTLTLAPLLSSLSEGPLEGEYCRNHGLTELGRHLIEEMMRRGMLIELDHLSRRAYAEVFARLEETGYPAIGSHGNHFGGRLYQLGGVSKVRFNRCQKEGEPEHIIHELTERVARLRDAGAYVAEGFGLDMNGFAGYPKPRFGEMSACAEPQLNPVTYPFESYAGDVRFTEPKIGERPLDFNTEGLVHLGLLPELIEDLRRGGASDEALEPLFRSAEGYIRMWERAEGWSAP